MHRTTIILRMLLVASVVLVLPLASDGTPQPQCDNVTTSLASTINNPVAGDEKFFTLPIGPSNVMFLLDVSGSMQNIPQCGDANQWGDGNALASCQWPTFASVSNPTSGNVNSDGTCSVSGNANLSWMANYDPTKVDLVDSGKGTLSNGLVDNPPWGSTCTGNACLFQKDAVYQYFTWTETSATPVTNPCTVSFTYTDYNCTTHRDETKTFTGTLPNCSACLTNTLGKGFYFYKNWTAAFTTNTHNNSGTCNGTQINYRYAGGGTNRGTATALMTGGWLNANPPKFMSARKVIKETAIIDPAVTKTTDQLRLGLSYTSTASTSSGCPVTIPNSTAIIVPLGPNTANSYPPNPTAFVQARQYILDALNHTHGGAAGWPSGVNLPELSCGGTPLATALFHVGQYFTTAGTYTSSFGSSSYELSPYAQTTAGWMNVPWVSSSSTSFCWSCQNSAVIIVTDGSPNSEMSFPSQITSAGGNTYQAPNNCGSGSTSACNVTSPSACCSPSDNSSNPPSRLPRVASWLRNNDLVPSALNNPQNLTVSAVSFNLPANNAQTILKATANMGVGSYNNAADGAGLAAAVAQAMSQVSNTATSFGAPAATALTTINAVDTKAFITRFRPTQKPTWEGHLFQWMLFDKAAAGCDPTKKYDEDDPTQQVTCRGHPGKVVNFDGAVTPDGYNICTGSMLVDADCDEVEEQASTGRWVKKGQGGADATPFWDAGNVLSNPSATGYRTAAEPAETGNIAPYTKYAPSKTPRNLWTALPNGTMYALETKNADVLAPYMNLSQAWCSAFESMAKLCGASPTCPVTDSGGNWIRYCAQQVILFARGWDVLDQDADGCAGPGWGISPPSGFQPNPANGTSATSNTYRGGLTRSCVITSSGGTNYTGEERDRDNDAAAPANERVPLPTGAPVPSFYKLGDIFHSSPVLVHPPAPESICRLGTDNQCVRTLFGYTSLQQYQVGYQTELVNYASCKIHDPDVDAYRAWRSSLRERENVVLVGSNDGLLHAFDAGGQNTTPMIVDGRDVNQPDGDCAYPMVEDGTGTELWGFVPPDILPRLRDTLLNHQYMVDGNVMVRDIWVDDAPADTSTNNPVPATDNALDGKKQKNEFRTVVIFGERSGGTQHTALDVTNAFSTNAANRPRPRMLWTFPPPRSEDAQYMGQSWSDFAPRPPPIGAVRLVPTSSEKATGSWVPPGSASADPQSFMEKWVVMINGGYDPAMNRGRAMWMLDAWTGSVYWRFTDTDFKAKVRESTSSAVGMFPVPAAAAMVDIGNPALGPDSDNFFDTATWGDMGGNLFVARFDRPGNRDSAGRVQNWRAARTFEEGRRTDDAQYATNRTEFFYMTSNALEPEKRRLRTLIGTGNREQILEQGQGCGPDNLMSCCQAGCTVSTTATINYGVCNSASAFQCTSSGQMLSPALTNGCGAGATDCTSSSSSFIESASYNLTCSATSATTGTGTATCDATGLCTVNPIGAGHDVTTSSPASCANKARFYGIWSYGGVDAKLMSTASDTDWTGAKTFDANRFTDTSSFGSCPYTPAKNCSLVDTTQAQVSTRGVVSCNGGATRCQAGLEDPGWFYTYNVTCPTSVACNAGCTNEKTASGAAILNSCASWNSFLPLGSTSSSSNPCAATGTAQQTAIGYASHYVSGTPDPVCNQGTSAALGSPSGVIYRGSQRGTIAPPAAPQVRYSTSGTGRVYYSTLQLDPQSPPTNSGLGGRDIATPLYWLELSREGHLCRHEGTNCK